MTLDASTVGLSTAAEDVKAIARTAAGDLLVSTLGTASVPLSGGGTLSAPDEDLFVLDGPGTDR